MAGPDKMSSNRPYLLRALYEWINDNNLTPYILVDAKQPGVQVPASTVKDGKVVVTCEFCSSVYQFTPHEAGVEE